MATSQSVGRVRSPLRAAAANGRVLVCYNGAHGVARPTFAPAFWTAAALRRF